MFCDAESRSVLAEERIAALHTAFAPSQHRARQWLSTRLIAAGERLAPVGKCRSVPERSNTRTRAAY
jgi:hypothetical protein